MVEKNPGNTVRDYAEVGMFPKTISRHLKLLGKVEKMDKWVPQEQNKNHNHKRFEISSSLFLRNQNDPFLNRIITCDEKWILCDNRKRSAQWLDADKAPHYFIYPKLHQKKVMVTGVPQLV